MTDRISFPLETAAESPITLADACAAIFGGKIKPSTLRAEAARGNLTIFRIGRRDFTTADAVREMVQKCRVVRQDRDFTLTQGGSSGLSEMERVSSARAAALETVMMLKSSSPATSASNTNRNRRETL